MFPPLPPRNAASQRGVLQVVCAVNLHAEMMGFFLVPLASALKMTKHLDHGCADCFDQPPAVVGWDLGFPDVTNPTYKPEVYAWQWTGGGRDDYCPNCFDAPTSENSLPSLPVAARPYRVVATQSSARSCCQKAHPRTSLLRRPACSDSSNYPWQPTLTVSCLLRMQPQGCRTKHRRLVALGDGQACNHTRATVPTSHQKTWRCSSGPMPLVLSPL